jgi:hypothetical protein
MTDKTGGSAFPTTQYASGISPSGHCEGMTLRDYFASHATEEDIKECIVRGDRYSVSADRVAARYKYADIMLKERSRGMYERT